MVFGWYRRPSQSVGIFLSCVAALFSGTVLINILVGSVVPQPYMDEIFHVDQMQRYCQGRIFEWNPKITTPPGLYATCLILLKPVMMFIRDDGAAACTVSVLRYFNALFLTILFCLYFALFRLLSYGTGKSASSVIISCSALNLTLFPVCYFFSFLFYTDILSVCSVVLCYLLQQRRYHFWSAVAGLFSCTVRQTNIVWVAFCASLTVVDIVVEYLQYFEAHKSASAKDSAMKNDANSIACDQKSAKSIVIYDDHPVLLLKSLRQMLDTKPKLIVNLITTVLFRSIGYILVGLSFIVFVLRNGSIVLGDKTAHQSCFHVMQAFYCAGFVAFFGLPPLFPYLSNVLRRLRRHGLFTRVLFVAILACIYQFTMDHPYLLADNRHYTFYIWRRWFILHPVMKYLLAPGYVLALYAIVASLHQQTLLWRVLFVCSCFLVTSPNRLLEFRYFIVPFVIWRLHLILQRKSILIIEFLFYIVVNVVTLYLFLFKPFQWSHEAGIQRFLW